MYLTYFLKAKPMGYKYSIRILNRDFRFGKSHYMAEDIWNAQLDWMIKLFEKVYPSISMVEDNLIGEVVTRDTMANTALNFMLKEHEQYVPPDVTRSIHIGMSKYELQQRVPLARAWTSTKNNKNISGIIIPPGAFKIEAIAIPDYSKRFTPV